MQLFISGQIQSVLFWKLCVPSLLNTVELLLRSLKGNKKITELNQITKTLLHAATCSWGWWGLWVPPAYLMTVIFCVVIETTVNFWITVVPWFLHILKLLDFVIICRKLQHRIIVGLLACKWFDGCLTFALFLAQGCKIQMCLFGQQGTGLVLKENKPRRRSEFSYWGQQDCKPIRTGFSFWVG